jgi:hypothetical protein
MKELNGCGFTAFRSRAATNKLIANHKTSVTFVGDHISLWQLKD